MKLRITNKVIETAIAPYNFNPGDILSIMPAFKVGEFECCILKLACNKVLVVANEMVLVYSTLENFLNGLDPDSLVKDSGIFYSPDQGDLDFKIASESCAQGNEEFSKVYELMFGAREANAQLIDGLKKCQQIEDNSTAS